jgi:uncharacterized membrane protein YfcA
MLVPPSLAWKLVLAIALGAGILLSAYAKAPRRAVPRTDLRWLVAAALILYGVGALSSLTHHPILAGVVYAAGICVCALAAWLSRGSDSEGPPGGEEPVDEEPPPEPEGAPWFDWRAFEREFREYAGRERAGVE